MRFTSLIVELVRARPRLVVWTAILAQSLLWLIISLVLYRSPPGEVATVLAFGREYMVGTDGGPSLAYWLGDIAFRLAGHHAIGVYLLAQACYVVMMLALFELGAAVVGGQQAALAVLLSATITAFGYPGLEFSPAVLTRPLWMLTLLHAWRAVGQGRPRAWFELSIDAGLLVLTSHSAILLIALLVGFIVATERGRKALLSVDALLALVLWLAIIVPYLIWASRSGALPLPHLPRVDQIAGHALRWGELLAAMIVAMFGIVLLVLLNAGWLAARPDTDPVIYRPPVEDYARRYVLFFALVPPLLATFLAALFGFEQIPGGIGTLLAPTGLAIVLLSGDLLPLRRHEILRTIWVLALLAPAVALLVSIFVGPWTTGREVATTLPSADMAEFFSESYQRRTGMPLRNVSGDPQLAALVSFAAAERPHLYLADAPQRTPWLTDGELRRQGGILIWRALDTAGTPPEEIARRFPDIAPEVPRAFERMINGRQPLLRIGWAILRPQS